MTAKKQSACSSFPGTVEDELRRLDFAIDHSYDAAAVLVDTVFYLVITVIRIVAELADVMLLSPDALIRRIEVHSKDKKQKR